MKDAARKLAAGLLTAVMVLSLGACAPSQGAGNSVEDQAAAQPLAAQSTEPVLSGEYVYVSEYTSLAGNEQEHISPRVYTDEGFYSVEFEKVGEYIPEDAQQNYDGEFATYESRLSFTGFDGSVRVLEKFEEMAAPENTQGLSDFSSGAGLDGIALAPDGSIYVIETTYSSWYDGPAGLSEMDASYWDYQQYVTEYYLRRLDVDGAELSRAKLQLEGDYIYTHSPKCDAEGNLLLTNDNAVCVFSPEGAELGRIPCQTYPDSLLYLADGRVAVSCWNTDGGMTVAALDTRSMSSTEICTLPGSAYSLTDGAGDYALFYISGSAFYGVRTDDASHEKLFNWINCDVNQSSISSIKAMDDGSFITVSNVYRPMGGEDYLYEVGFVTIKKLPVEYAPEKTVLSFATIYLDQEASDMIVDFNRTNPDYRIEVRDYFEYNTETDFTVGPRKLFEDLSSGRGADIIDLDGLPYEIMASRGLLEDLYPYIERDGGLSREDFFASVLSALEVDGKLCSTVGGFSVNTLIASDLAVTDTDGWTYAQLYETLALMPEGCEIFDAYTSGSDVVRNFLPFELERCIDWKNGQCNFNNESFLALLDFASSFPLSFDWENYNWTETDSSEYRLSRGLQLLSLGTLHTFDDLNYNTAYFGTGVNYVGYPGLDGEFRSSFITSHRFAMNAAGANKDGAWEFLRAFLTQEHQSKNIWNFPVRLDVYEQWREKAMEATYLTDEQGELVLTEEGAPIVLPIGKMGGIQGTVVDVYPITHAQADELRQLIDTTSTLSDISSIDAIGEIVIAEAERFFGGEISADEATANMNSAVGEYLRNNF